MNSTATSSTEIIKSKLIELFDDVLAHDGFGEIKIEMRILKRQQKEIILHCGKQYRFVVDNPQLKISEN